MATLMLPCGAEVLLDDADLQLVNDRAWFSTNDKNAHTKYARTTYSKNGERSSALMHRKILGVVGDRSICVDHINGNGLDNRRANLRLCTATENSMNRRMNKNNTTGYRGVHFKKDRDKYGAIITAGGRRRHLGYFDSAEAASEAHEAVRRELFGEFFSERAA